MFLKINKNVPIMGKINDFRSIPEKELKIKA